MKRGRPNRKRFVITANGMEVLRRSLAVNDAMRENTVVKEKQRIEKK
jgi:DNA-binding PadR family transcriptional regulator